MESVAARFVTKRYVVGHKAMYKAYSDDRGNSYQERVWAGFRRWPTGWPL